jgi:hypothetical protein
VCRICRLGAKLDDAMKAGKELEKENRRLKRRLERIAK